MKLNVSKILLKKSDTVNKVPAASALTAGEVALNYNSERPFLSFKDQSEKVTQFFRDRFLIDLEYKSTVEEGDVLTPTSGSSYVTTLKIDVSSDYHKNGILIRYDGRIYLPCNESLYVSAHKTSVLFSNVSLNDNGGLVVRTIHHIPGNDEEKTILFLHKVYVFDGSTMKLNGYESSLDSVESGLTDPIDATMTVNEAVSTIVKEITENELTVAAAINALNERIDDLQEQINNL